jgi:hypothetical protein
MYSGTRYIRAIDWVDARILRHRFYRLCVYVCAHPDWDKR